MDTIHQRFPQYDEAGQALIDKAYAIASAALADETRGNGHPFIEHPVNVALIAADEIGLPADCVAAVFLHEATRSILRLICTLADSRRMCTKWWRD